jgi:hypothetical protein
MNIQGVLSQKTLLRPRRKILFFERSPKINFRAAKIDFWRAFKKKFSAGSEGASFETGWQVCMQSAHQARSA